MKWTRGRRQLARYMIRNPFSLKKMEYRAQQGMLANICIGLADAHLYNDNLWDIYLGFRNPLPLPTNPSRYQH